MDLMKRISCWVLVLFAFGTVHAQPESRPNIIVILADDLGYGDVNVLNPRGKIKTPNIDQLAKNGMIFTDGHSSSAVCTPTRYGLLTGRYNWRSDLKSGVLGIYGKPLIAQGRTTLASMLGAQGYQTAMFGKWHLGFNWGTLDGNKPVDKEGQTNIDFGARISGGPLGAGFDYFFGVDAPNYPPYTYIENDRLLAQPDRFLTFDPVLDSRPGRGRSDWDMEKVLPELKRRTLEYIKADRGKSPFFLYLPLTAPHTPIVPSAPFKGSSGLNLYADFVKEVDAYVGELVNTLRATKQLENTIIVFTSDNGCSPRADFEFLTSKGHDPSFIYRGHKADIFEGGHRVPLIIQWPAQIAKGQVCNQTVCLNDLMATAAEINHYKLRDNEGEDSFSLLPLLKNPQSKAYQREAVVHHSINGSFAIRKGKWKLELVAGSGGWSNPKPGKEEVGLPEFQLYDMEKDPEETKNLYSAHPEIASGMTKLLKSYVENGRSTKGSRQVNDGKFIADRMTWMGDSN
jgi:arylsulfatase A